MKIVNQNATAALFEKAEELNHRSTEGWKCIYFKVPDAQERQAHAMPQFDASVVTHMLARMRGVVYLCDNGEIFILYRGAYHSLTTRLSMYLWTFYSDWDADRANHQLFSLFDLSAQWSSFYRFCEKRYMDALAASETQGTLPNAPAPIPAELLRGDHVAGYIGGK